MRQRERENERKRENQTERDTKLDKERKKENDRVIRGRQRDRKKHTHCQAEWYHNIQPTFAKPNGNITLKHLSQL